MAASVAADPELTAPVSSHSTSSNASPRAGAAVTTTTTTAASASATAAVEAVPAADESTSLVAAGAPARSSYRSLDDSRAEGPADKQQRQQQQRTAPSDTSSRAARQRRPPAGLTAAATQTSHLDDEDRDEDEGRLQAWLRDFFDKFGSVELENKGSTARDHLALERTFLAWLRTSLSFAGVGIAITQLFRLNVQSPGPASPPSSPPSADSSGRHYSIQHDMSAVSQPLDYSTEAFRSASASMRLRAIGTPLGASFLGLAILVLLLGWRRYIESQHYIIKGKFPASRGSIGILAVASGALVITTFVIVLVIRPSMIKSG